MKKLLLAAALAAGAFQASAADVDMSISVGQPGFYGRIDIGDYPAPQMIYRRPIAVQRVPMNRPPVYLHVPPGHAKHWSRHCREYNACDERVYFVRSNWYNTQYVPRYQERTREHRMERREERRDDRREEREDRQRSEQRNQGNDGNRGHDNRRSDR